MGGFNDYSLKEEVGGPADLLVAEEFGREVHMDCRERLLKETRNLRLKVV